MPVMGRLYKDSRGRRCWLVARNPGMCAFFIEGRPVKYQWFTDQQVTEGFVLFDPPRDETPEPDWGHLLQGFRLCNRDLFVRRCVGSWNGWVGVEIYQVGGWNRFYILPMKRFLQVVEPKRPQTVYQRLLRGVV